MANDFLWLNNPTLETEKLAVAFVKDNYNPRVGNLNKNYYLLNPCVFRIERPVHDARRQTLPQPASQRYPCRSGARCRVGQPRP